VGLARIVLLDTNALFIPFTSKIFPRAGVDRMLGAYEIRVPARSCD